MSRYLRLNMISVKSKKILLYHFPFKYSLHQQHNNNFLLEITILLEYQLLHLPPISIHLNALQWCGWAVIFQHLQPIGSLTALNHTTVKVVPALNWTQNFQMENSIQNREFYRRKRSRIKKIAGSCWVKGERTKTSSQKFLGHNGIFPGGVKLPIQLIHLNSSIRDHPYIMSLLLEESAPPLPSPKLTYLLVNSYCSTFIFINTLILCICTFICTKYAQIN